MSIVWLPAVMSDRVGFGQVAVTGIFTNWGIFTFAMSHFLTKVSESAPVTDSPKCSIDAPAIG
jgi:hypothetical protein